MSVSIRDLNLNLLPFVPLIKSETAHSQTLLGHIVKSPFFKRNGQFHLLTLSDGDCMGLTLFPNKKKYVVVVFHGLGGDASSDYMDRTARVAYALGYNVVKVEHRGAGSVVDKAQKPYHSGRGEDASEVSLWLRKNRPDLKQIFIGFSMSGSILLNLVTRRYGHNLPDYCVVVNAPINLSRASKLLTQGFSKIYDIRFYYRLKKIILQRETSFKLPFVGTTRTIDDMYTSVKSGFLNGEDYYKKCSTKDYVENISVPTFVLTSKDDPFIDYADYEDLTKRNKWNNLTHTTFTQAGGHMGYLAKNNLPKFGKRWLDHYLYRVLKTIDKLN